MKSCDICGEGEVTDHLDEVDYWDYYYSRHTILTKWSECDTCGSEFADAAQVRFNKEQVVSIDKVVDRLSS